MRNKARRVAFLAAFTAAAVIFSYVEAVIPVPLIPIAGFRLGFSNIAILTVLYLFGSKDALAVLTARSVISALLFTGMIPLILSISGGLLSTAVMSLLKKCEKFSVVGISVAGATFHNIGQCAAAALILQTCGVFAYLPALMICSLVCGALVGIICAFILKILARSAVFKK